MAGSWLPWMMAVLNTFVTEEQTVDAAKHRTYTQMYTYTFGLACAQTLATRARARLQLPQNFLSELSRGTSGLGAWGQCGTILL